MIHTHLAGTLLVIVLAVTVVVTVQLGHWLGCKAKESGVDITKGTGTIEGGVLGLLGLILAFNLFNQETRFERRIALVTDQLTSLGVVYDQVRTLPEPARSDIRTLLREYKDASATVFNTNDGRDERLPRRGTRLYQQFWQEAVRACQTQDPEYCTNMLLPSISGLEQLALAYVVAQETHSPWVILSLLCVLSTCAAGLGGYSMGIHPRRRALVHQFLFLVTLSATFYTIVDLEFPHGGLIKIQDAIAPAVHNLERRMM